MSFLDKIAAAVAPAASDEQRAEARRKAEQLGATEPWLAAIIDQHKQIESLVEGALGAGGDGVRRDLVRQLCAILTAHSSAEETVIYPDVVEFSGKTHATMAYEEHALTKINLAKLEKMDPSSDDWREKLEHIQSALQQHMYQEEDSWLPDLVENAPAGEKQRMARRFAEEFSRCGGGREESRQTANAGHAAPAVSLSPLQAPGDGMEATQAMPQDGLKGAPDGVNSQAEWGATGGSQAGAPYPNPHTGRDAERENVGNGFMGHGGQSKMGYHGSGQLGEQDVERGGNQNAGTRDR